MKKGKFLLIAAAVTFGLAACDKDKDVQATTNESSNSQDSSFALQASLANQSEIAAGQIASGRAANSGVRSFAQMMVTEHGSAQADLSTAAGRANLSVNADTSAFAAIRTQLMALSGRAFDSTYLALQVAGHSAVLSMLQMEATSGLSTSLKGYATAQIPHVQEHLRVADSLRLHL